MDKSGAGRTTQLMRKGGSYHIEHTMWFLILLLAAFHRCFSDYVGCRPNCEPVQMEPDLVPNVYNNCSCTIPNANQTDYDESAEVAPVSCIAQFRSLKFRNDTTGAIVQQRAVTKSCVDEGEVFLVNQTAYDKQETEFLARKKAAAMENLESSFSTWVFGFRTKLMKFYKSHDSHLRFG